MQGNNAVGPTWVKRFVGRFFHVIWSFAVSIVNGYHPCPEGFVLLLVPFLRFARMGRCAWRILCMSIATSECESGGISWPVSVAVRVGYFIRQPLYSFSYLAPPLFGIWCARVSILIPLRVVGRTRPCVYHLIQWDLCRVERCLLHKSLLHVPWRHIRSPSHTSRIRLRGSWLELVLATARLIAPFHLPSTRIHHPRIDYHGQLSEHLPSLIHPPVPAGGRCSPGPHFSHCGSDGSGPLRSTYGSTLCGLPRLFPRGMTGLLAYCVLHPLSGLASFCCPAHSAPHLLLLRLSFSMPLPCSTRWPPPHAWRSPPPGVASHGHCALSSISCSWYLGIGCTVASLR